MGKGCLAYLSLFQDTRFEIPTPEMLTMVSEFLDVLLQDLPSIPPDCDIDFGIGTLPDTQTNFSSTY